MGCAVAHEGSYRFHILLSHSIDRRWEGEKDMIEAQLRDPPDHPLMTVAQGERTRMADTKRRHEIHLGRMAEVRNAMVITPFQIHGSGRTARPKPRCP